MALANGWAQHKSLIVKARKVVTRITALANKSLMEYMSDKGRYDAEHKL